MYLQLRIKNYESRAKVIHNCPFVIRKFTYHIFSANSAFSAVNLKCDKVKLVLVINKHDWTRGRQIGTGCKSLP